jgi:hypothetical protein
MNLKINKMNEDQLLKLVRMFMEQFPLLEPMSLDEFLAENFFTLSSEQLSLGYYILELFDNFYFKPE